jgi:hypothetical protein
MQGRAENSKVQSRAEHLSSVGQPTCISVAERPKHRADRAARRGLLDFPFMGANAIPDSPFRQWVLLAPVAGSAEPSA